MNKSLYAKDGELKVLWGKLPHDQPDIIFSNGEGTSKCDQSLLYYYFCCKKPNYDYLTQKVIFEPSLVEELEKRGYDIKTIKFSIQKVQHEND